MLIVGIVVWMGCRDTTSAAHYDVVDNFYVQFYGRKRFVLFPPTSHRSLYVYPRNHPHTRQSQVDFSSPDLYKFKLLRPVNMITFFHS